MENPEDEKVVKQEEEKIGCMDIVKKGSYFAGIAIVAGYITSAIIFRKPLWLLEGLDFIFPLLIPTMLGGIIGGALFKKWWGAGIGGVITNVITIFIMLYLLIAF